MMYQFPVIENNEIFEKLIRDIMRLIYKDPNIELYGRRGQKQDGIDGYFKLDSKIIAFQCKEKEINIISEDKLREKIKKEMKDEFINAKNFLDTSTDLKFEKYIFATTFKNDTHLQNEATLLNQKYGISVEYWGWKTVSDYIQNSQKIIKEYYPQFIIQPDISNFVRVITKSEINNNLIDELKKIEIAKIYYKVNDHDDLIFKVVCNDLDIENIEMIEEVKEKIMKINKSAIWIIGEGGTGKTTFLYRLAVKLSKEGEKSILINFKNLPDNLDIVNNILEYILTFSSKKKVFLFIDNPNSNHKALEYLLTRIENVDLDYIIILTERENRYNLIKEENLKYLISNQEKIEPFKLYINPKHREKVYNQFFKLFGNGDNEAKRIIEKIGIKNNIAFVNSTYKILSELNKINSIKYGYIFDRVEYEKTLEKRLSQLKGTYKYIAIMSYFRVKLYFNVLQRMYGLSESESKSFIELFSQNTLREPIIVVTRIKDRFEKEYYLRTKHEIISELFFMDKKEIDKEKLIIELLNSVNYYSMEEAQGFINIFGNKENICDNFINLEEIIDYIFMKDELKEKIKINETLDKTLMLSKFWILIRDEKYYEGIQLIIKCLETYPSDLYFRTELGKVYQNLGQYDEAERVLLKCIAIDRNDLYSRTELGRVYQKLEQYDKAEKVLLECLDIDNNCLPPRTELGKVYQKLGQYHKAEKVLLEYSEIDKSDVHPRTELGRVYQKLGQYNKAEEVLLECLALEKNGIHPRTELGKVYQKLKQYDKAEKILLECLEIDKNEIHPRTELGKVYQKLGQYDKAEKILLEYLAIDKNGLHPRLELSKVYQKLGQYRKTEKLLLECLAIDKNGIHPRTELGKLYQKLGQYSKAEKILLKCLEIEKKGLHPRLELGKVYQKLGHHDKAEKILMEYLAIDKNGIHPRTELGKVYQKIGQYDKAEKVLSVCLEIDKNCLHPRLELAKVYQKIGQYYKAEKILLEYLAIDENGLHPRTELGKVYQKLGQYDKAEKILLESIAIDENDLYFKAELGKLYQKLGQYDKAEKIFMDLLSIDKKNFYALSGLLSIYRRIPEKAEDALQKFDEFFMQEKIKIDQHSQAAFFIFFKLCKEYINLNEIFKLKANEYYEKYKNNLDKKNIDYYEMNFK